MLMSMPATPPVAAPAIKARRKVPTGLPDVSGCAPGKMPVAAAAAMLPSAAAASARPPERGKGRVHGQWNRSLKKPFGHRVALVILMALDVTLLGSCQPQTTGGLPTTLGLRSVRGGEVAYEDGLPVPSF